MRNPDDIKSLTQEELNALLEALNTRYDSGKKNLAMFLLMARAGLRVGEVSGLRLQDVDLDQGTLYIHRSKNDKSRRVSFPDNVTKALKEWLEVRPETAENAECEWFFTTRKGTPTSTASIRQTVYRYSEKAKIDRLDRVSPHVLRHTYATHFLQRGGSPRALQRLLGHSSLQTTMIYVHKVDNSHLEENKEVWD